MARPRKPTAVLNITGAFAKNPNRKRPGEPKPTGGIGPYRPLTEGSLEPAKIWDELVGMCAPGVLTNSDRAAMEIAVEYLRQFRVDPIHCSAERVKTLIALLARFGMTPSDRAKLSLPEPPNSSEVVPWDKFTIT